MEQDIYRRAFLLQLFGGAAAFAQTEQGRSSARSVRPNGQLQVLPHYREQVPLDTTLPKVDPDLDHFLNERVHDRIAPILQRWSRGLLQSPSDIRPIENSLANGFSGSSLNPVQARVIRPGQQLEVHRVIFGESKLPGNAFLQDLRLALQPFLRILNADFQITEISSDLGSVRTEVRYELLGSGKDFYREQRIGCWTLAWEATPSGEYRLLSWLGKEETRSRSKTPCYSEISGRALGRNASYRDQLLHGVDHWRTVLDGASGIDIYGHNGVSAGDIDGDGFDDLYICQPAGLPNRLYRNRGNGTFDDITEWSGVGVLENTACALFADFDNDGRQDLVVVRANGPLLFLNQGGGKFVRKPDAFQFATMPQGTFTGAAVADYNRDGLLDIYFCLYVYYQGANQYKYPSPYFDAENGPPNFLMRNNGDRTFRDVTAESGLNRNNSRFSFCCGWGDYNGDGWPDLYVVNDFGRKNLYRNNGDGTFNDIAAQAGVEDVGAGMSVCWLDYNNDGAQDLYVADMWTAAGERISAEESFQKAATNETKALYRKHAMGNSVFLNRDGKPFEDVTSHTQAGMGRWSWSSDAWDFDHDGFPDLYITNGMLSGPLQGDLNSFFWRQVVANSPDRGKFSAAYEEGWNAINELIRADGSWSGFERNVFYANNRDGTFSNVSGATGLDFIEDGRAFALADFDGDGRQEIFLKNRNGPQLRVLKNVMPDLPPSISFRLRGTKSNRDAIGASVRIDTESGTQTRFLQAGSGFLSQHSKEIFFGLGTARNLITATVHWPSGLVQKFKDLPLNHRISVEEGSATPAAEPFKDGSEPFKKDVKAAVPSQLQQPEAQIQQPELFPVSVETWLLVPVSAPDFTCPDREGRDRTLSAFRGKPVLLTFQLGASQEIILNLNGTVLKASDDVIGTYNLLHRYLFDRHRDMALPTSFLLNEKGEIVKVYGGSLNPERVQADLKNIPASAEGRLAKALPFHGVSESFEFGRNHLSLGSVFFQHGYLEPAETSFRAALAEDPSSAEAQYGLASVYLKQNKTAEAGDGFERTLKLKSTYPDTELNAWNNLGLLATRDNKYEEAIDYFDKALERNPEYFIALQNLGNAYRQLKRWPVAQKCLERAIAIKPDDPEANYSLGMVFAQIGDNGRAYTALQTALKLRPGYPEALNNLGVLYLRTARISEAVKTFEECIRVAPQFDQSYLNLARVYAIRSEKDKAKAVLSQLLALRPDDAQAKIAMDQLR